MSLFVVDTAGDSSLFNKNNSTRSSANVFCEKSTEKCEKKNEFLDTETEDDDDEDYFGLPPPTVDLSDIIKTSLYEKEKIITKTDEELKRVNEAFKMAVENPSKASRRNRGKRSEIDHSDFNLETGKYLNDEELRSINIDQELRKSVIGPGFEKLKGLPNIKLRKQRVLNREERSKTKGNSWFDLPATEITEELENDLKILQMRSVLDPKHFYKKNDLKVLPKYFQIGTVQHSPLDYYKERNSRKNKKKSLVDELLADPETVQYTKRKFKEVIANNKYARRKAMKKMKKLKKNK